MENSRIKGYLSATKPYVVANDMAVHYISRLWDNWCHSRKYRFTKLYFCAWGQCVPPCLKSATCRQHLKIIEIVVRKKDAQLLHCNTPRPIAIGYLINKDSRVKTPVQNLDKQRSKIVISREWMGQGEVKEFKRVRGFGNSHPRCRCNSEYCQIQVLRRMFKFFRRSIWK